MKSGILAFVMSACTPQVVHGNLLWSEEFGQGGLDLDTWNVETGRGVNGWGNFELQTYTEENVVVQDETLQIIVNRNPNDGSFRSGRINTAGKVELRYGTVQARIRVPDVAEGLWPAFWTLGSDYTTGTPWPACGEIDIMEVGQGLALREGLGNRRVISAAHWERNDTYVSFPGQIDADTDLHLDFVTVTLDWTPERITTYLNDVEIWKMDIGLDVCSDCEEFHQPHFIILNVAVGGGFTSGSQSSSSTGRSGCGGSSSSGIASSGVGCVLRTESDITAPLPASMIIDWVRIYDNGSTTLTSRTKAQTEPPRYVPLGTLPPVPSPVPQHFQADSSTVNGLDGPSPTAPTSVAYAPPPPSVAPIYLSSSENIAHVTSPPVSHRTECPDGYTHASGVSGKSGKGYRTRGLTTHGTSECIPASHSKGKGKSMGKGMSGKGSKGMKSSSEEIYSGLAVSSSRGAQRASILTALGAIGLAAQCL